MQNNTKKKGRDFKKRCNIPKNEEVPTLLCMTRKIHACPMLHKVLDPRAMSCGPSLPRKLTMYPLHAYTYVPWRGPSRIAPCSWGTWFHSSTCLSHARLWIQIHSSRRPLSLRFWFRHRRPLCSRGPDFLLKKPLKIMFSFSKRSLPLEVLISSSRCPHLQGAVFLLHGVHDFEFSFFFFSQSTPGPLFEASWVSRS